MDKKKKKKKEKIEESRGRKVAKVLLIILGVIAGLIMLGLLTVTILRMRGKKELSINLSTGANGMGGITISGNEFTQSELRDDAIVYNGVTYIPNDDLVTILVMGIDKEVYEIIDEARDAETYEDDYLHGGQSDALFLIIMNPHTKTLSLYSINRNAMTEVDVFKADGHYDGRYLKQIALQHGYGDGGEESCMMTVKTVSRMMKNIPINAYVSLAMDSIPELNDAIGGVAVTAPDDVYDSKHNLVCRAGEVVNLEGEDAYYYIRWREHDMFNSNEARFTRQKQYIVAFAQKAKALALRDFSVATNLYNLAGKYMVTSIDIDGFTYLATECLGYSIDLQNVHSLPGEVVMGDQFEEFYINDSELEKQIVELFYEPLQ